MNEPSTKELRRIRQLLTAILVCLLVIVFAVAPGLILLAIVALIAYGLLMVLLSVSQTARYTAAQVWFQMSSFWRH
jgi:hypothetical protein